MSIRTGFITATFAALLAIGTTLALSATPSTTTIADAPAVAAQFVLAPAQSGCPRTVEQSLAMIQDLSGIVEVTRAQADVNPLYEADLGYYRAELARAKTCVQNVADFSKS
jgi:hypothetical protein